MSDYSFMKTGRTNFALNTSDSFELDAIALLTTFMDYAIRAAGHYVKHAGRRVVQVKDIKLHLMLEAYSHFSKREPSDILTKVEHIKNIIREDCEEDDEEDVDYEEKNLFEEEEEWSFSSCPCSNCISILSIEKKFQEWTPPSPMLSILKKCITNMPDF